MDGGIRVTGFDHLVLNVEDVERSLAFYCDVLGLEPLRVEEWRRGEVGFPSVRLDPSSIIDLVRAPRRQGNVDHFCLVVEPTDFSAVAAGGRVQVEEGPGRRWGARGEATAMYVRDPDGNLVELRYYD